MRGFSSSTVKCLQQLKIFLHTQGAVLASIFTRKALGSSSDLSFKTLLTLLCSPATSLAVVDN